jgi:hypothetical protein
MVVTLEELLLGDDRDPPTHLAGRQGGKHPSGTAAEGPNRWKGLDPITRKPWTPAGIAAQRKFEKEFAAEKDVPPERTQAQRVAALVKGGQLEAFHGTPAQNLDSILTHGLGAARDGNERDNVFVTTNWKIAAGYAEGATVAGKGRGGVIVKLSIPRQDFRKHFEVTGVQEGDTNHFNAMTERAVPKKWIVDVLNRQGKSILTAAHRKLLKLSDDEAVVVYVPVLLTEPVDEVEDR